MTKTKAYATIYQNWTRGFDFYLLERHSDQKKQGFVDDEDGTLDWVSVAYPEQLENLEAIAKTSSDTQVCFKLGIETSPIVDRLFVQADELIRTIDPSSEELSSASVTNDFRRLISLADKVK
jgi:hypothetical protein